MIDESASLNSEGVTALLAQNRTFFDRAACAALNAARLGRSEQAMLWAKFAAECTWLMHPGFYSHPPLEVMLRELGESLSGSAPVDVSPLPARKRGTKTWLHIITSAYMTGGHTRLVERMIANATVGNNDQHSILLIDQGKVPIPSWLGDAAESSGGKLIKLPSEFTLVDRARAVRQIARAWADTVILHIHPNDPVAPVAFASAGGPPVVFVNHSDHLFWLGAGCVDVVADIRLEGHEITVARRGKFPSIVLPIPLDLPVSSISAEEARSVLGISADTVVLLAIAASFKFFPYGNVDFPANAVELLQIHKNALLLVIGPTTTDQNWHNALTLTGERIRLLGVQKNIELYYAAADICLESYPVGSLTSTFDAMLRGVPVLRAPQGVPPILTMSDYDGLGDIPVSNVEYLHRASELITDSTLRKVASERQRKSVMSTHSGLGWREAWQRLVSSIPVSHAPLNIQMESWDCPADLDLVWADIQVRQSDVHLDNEVLFNNRIRKMHKKNSRGFLFFKLLSEAVKGNWIGAKILFRNIRHL